MDNVAFASVTNKLDLEIKALKEELETLKKDHIRLKNAIKVYFYRKRKDKDEGLPKG